MTFNNYPTAASNVSDGPPTVIYYSAIWCTPCKALYPQVERVCKQEGVTLRKVDIDTEPAPAWLTSVPTMIVNGTVLTGMTATPAALRKVLQNDR